MQTDRFFIITGGPGSGKTMLITALGGINRMPESGRAVIQDELATSGDALPWHDPLAFAGKMLEKDTASWEAAHQLKGPVIFDRAIPDAVGYLTLSGLAVPPHIARAAAQYRYNRRVFIAPPWREIYETDSERKQDFAEAERTFEVLSGVYRECGYELSELPKLPPSARAQFVVERLSF